MIDIFLSPDCMEAFIKLDSTDPDRDKIGFTDIFDAIRSKLPIIPSMIDTEAIERFVSNKTFNIRVRVAKGIPPKKGTDGTLKWEFDTRKSCERIDLSLMEEEDYKDCALYDTVERNQLLVSVTMPVLGEPGKDLFGRRVEAPLPVKAIMPEGKFTITSADKTRMYAARSGRVAIHNGIVEVFECFCYNGNCDAKTGDINFAGDVIIEGNVYEGMSITAAGNIEVMGAVEGALLHAQGDIILRKGMSSAGKGMVVSQRSVIAAKIENATVEAKETIMAGSILHSNVFCVGLVEAVSIVGGNTYAGQLIKAKTMGSPMRTNTIFEVGMLPKYRERLAEIEREASQCDEGLLELLQLAKGLPNKETEAVKEVKMRLTREVLALREKKAALEKEAEHITVLFRPADEGQVRASEHAYAGCKIMIGSAGYTVEFDEDASQFSLEESVIIRS